MGKRSQLLCDIAILAILASIAWVVGWWGVRSAAGDDGWRSVPTPAMVAIPDGAVPREDLVETQYGMCTPSSCSPRVYQPAPQSIPVRHVPGPQGPAGPQGPPGRDAAVDYEQLSASMLTMIAGDDRFRGPPGPPGPKVTEIDYDQLAGKVAALLAQDGQLVAQVSQQVSQEVQIHGPASCPAGEPGPAGPPGPPGPPPEIDDAFIDEIAARVRARIAGEIHYEFIPD